MRRRKAFTFVELVIVVAIIGILAVTAIGYFQDYMSDAREAVSRQNLSVVRGAISQFFQYRMQFPTTFTQLNLNQNIERMLLDPLNDGTVQLMIEVPDTVSHPGVSPNPAIASFTTFVTLARGADGDGSHQFRNVKISGRYQSW